MDLGVGQARVVVDTDEDDLPAHATTALAIVAMDGVADAPDLAEALGIDVEQASRVGVLVAFFPHAFDLLVVALDEAVQR